MSQETDGVALVCGITASAFCLGGGLWILTVTGFNRGTDAMSTAIGLYFIGKAFFVGPMLWIAARRTTKS